MRSKHNARVAILMTSLVLSLFAASAAAAPGRAPLHGSVPAWANSKNYVQPADATNPVNFRVYLGWKNRDGAVALAQAVSEPHNKAYKQYLTPAQFRQLFAPSQADVNAVQAWLRGAGFTIVDTPQNNHYVSAEGTVAQAQAAFGVAFGTYAVHGLLVRSPNAEISIPASLSGVVSAIVGLDDSFRFIHLNHPVLDAPPAPAFVTGQPCSLYWAEKLAVGFTNPYGSGALPYAPCGYTPQQIKGAYGLSSVPFDGSGQTVAIVDPFASPTIVDDVNQWSVNRGLPPFKANQFTQIVAPGTYRHPERGVMDPQNAYGEETLDVEAVHGMAPGAKIVFVGSPNFSQDIDAALNFVVDRGIAHIVSNSYGFPLEALPRGFVIPLEDTILQGAVEGIGIYFSSGDDGDESQVVGFASADWPASSPFVTAVGGTSLAVDNSNNYLFETPWGTTTSSWTGTDWSPAAPGSWLYGGGGGVSILFDVPSYQQGVVPDAVFSAQGRTGRAVPDIAAVGDPNTGYLVGQTQAFPDGSVKYSEYKLGGTSLSAPLIAGIMALVDECAGIPLGFANPRLYAAAGTAAFNDITSPASTVAVVRTNFVNSVDASDGLAYVLRTMNQTLSLEVTPGYDDVTGLGTPAAGFIGALCQ